MTDDDELDELLTPRPSVPDTAKRDALLARTERMLVAERRYRHATRIAAVVGVLAAGVAIGWLSRPERVVEVVAERPVPVFVPLYYGGITGIPSSPGPPPLSATAAELQAEQADDDAAAARLYRAAGDAFLGDQDYRNAMRCYRLHLARAGDDALATERGDSWMLTSLKNAAYKEKIDVSNIRD
jgi:hypothetical protein